MNRSRRMLTAVSTVALLVAATASVSAQTDNVASDAGALATGQVFHVDEIDFTQITERAGSRSERGRTFTRRSEMSDPRLSGEVVVHDNADRWFTGSPPSATFLADVLWGTIEITNDGGAWTGTGVGTTDTTADGAGVTYYELAGSGGYAGMSAVIFEHEVWDPATETGEWFWNGVIFPGDLPPDR